MKEAESRIQQMAFWRVVMAAIVAATGAVFIKFMDLSPGAIGWMRALVPTIGFGTIIYFSGSTPFHKKYMELLPLSLLSSLRLFLFIAGFVYTSMANAVVLFYSYPIFTLLLANRLIGERLSFKQVLCIIGAFLGIVIIYLKQEFTFGSSDFLGMGAALCAAIVWSYIVILMKRFTVKFHRNEILYVQNFTGVIFFLPFFLLDWKLLNVPNLSYGFLYGLIIGLGTYSLMLAGLKYLKASITSSLMFLEVPVTIIFGLVLFNEQLNPFIIVGGSLIVLCAFLLRRMD